MLIILGQEYAFSPTGRKQGNSPVAVGSHIPLSRGIGAQMKDDAHMEHNWAEGGKKSSL